MQRSLTDRIYASVIGAIAGFGMLLLLAPTLIVVIISFTGGITLKFPPPSWSMRWYGELLNSREIIDPALTSLKVAALASVLDALFMSPMVLPAMAFGLSLLLVFNMLGIRLSVATLVLGHTIICVPFVIRMVGASVQQLNPVLIPSSLSLGTSHWYTFRRITLPLIKRGIIASCFVAFLSSFDNVPVSLFLADARTEVLPIKLWAILEGSLDVRVAAVSGVIVIVTLIGLIAAEAFGGVTRQIGTR